MSTPTSFPATDAVAIAVPLPKEDKTKNKKIWWIGGALLLVVAATAAFLIRRVAFTSENQVFTTAPTTAPTSTECPTKRVRVTHLCQVPDLDDDFFGRDVTLDLQLLLDSLVYWPEDVRTDCPDGSYKGACEIPDAWVLQDCYAISSTAVRTYDLDSEDLLRPADWKWTIYDKDIGTDEFLDIRVRQSEWYHPNVCETEEFQFYQDYDESGQGVGASIKVIVENIDETALCGTEVQDLQDGLEATAEELAEMQRVLQRYTSLDDATRLLRGERKLFLPALFAGAKFLVSGVARFGGLFARGARSQGLLSNLADISTIGSVWFGLGGTSSSDNSAQLEEQAQYQKEQFEQIARRFDQIDVQLGNLSTQLSTALQSIQLILQEELANQELDEWILVHLGTLRQDYQAYADSSHTVATRALYQETFRKSCTGRQGPNTIFSVLYSHVCSDCELFSGKSQQYLLDDFVRLANQQQISGNEDAVTTHRVLWFRQTFGTLMVAALTEILYLHSVCLYQPLDGLVCQNEDPVWKDRLEEMGQALEEAAQSLVDAEERIQ